MHSSNRGDEVLMGELHSLDPPRGAGGVEDRRRVVQEHFHSIEPGAAGEQEGFELRRVEDHRSLAQRRQPGGVPGGGEGDYGAGEVDLVGDIGVGRERIGRRDNGAEGEQGEVEEGNVDGIGREYESDVVLVDVEVVAEVGGKGSDEVREVGEGDAAGGGGVDK